MKEKVSKIIFILSFCVAFLPIIYNVELLGRIRLYNGFLEGFIGVKSSFEHTDIYNKVCSVLCILYSFSIVAYTILYFLKKPTLIISTATALLAFFQHYTRIKVCYFTLAGKYFDTISIFGILEMLFISFLYLATVGLIIYAWIKVIKSHPHRPTKAERLEARVAELEQQVEDLKKGD